MITPHSEPRIDGTLELTDLRVRYLAARGEPALGGISLRAVAGDVVGVAGRTGAGKSTLALAAAGFIPRVVRARVDGTVTIDGRPLIGASSSQLAGTVGIVFSTPSNQLSASKLSVREELAFGLENLGLPRAAMDERIDDVLARLGIEHLADREPFALSGGEQQRVAIASIVAMGTRVLVLDEPTAQLDPAGSRSVASLLRELATAGGTIVCAEHDPTVLGLANRCLVLEGGLAVALDLPARALDSASLRRIGLRPPTLVLLAELAGAPAELAFDEAAIAAGLASRSGRARLRAVAARILEEDEAIGAAVNDWTPLQSARPTALEIDGLAHRYPRGVEALRGVDLRIESGEAVAIVGQNGSGKTTLVKHLNGLLRPEVGRVLVAGRDIADDPVYRVARTVGFVFQNPDEQLFSRSVEREVAFGPRNLGVDAAAVAAMVERALALTGLVDVRAVNPYDLGLSIRKLVALASVLAMEPSVLVLDEPTTGQDSPGIDRIGAIVRAYGRTGRTVVAVTHDMEFAARHFDRIVVMRDGRVVGDGPPGAVFGSNGAATLRSTGLEPPPAARIGTRLDLGSTPTVEALVEALRALP